MPPCSADAICPLETTVFGGCSDASSHWSTVLWRKRVAAASIDNLAVFVGALGYSHRYSTYFSGSRISASNNHGWMIVDTRALGAVRNGSHISAERHLPPAECQQDMNDVEVSPEADRDNLARQVETVCPGQIDFTFLAAGAASMRLVARHRKTSLASATMLLAAMLVSHSRGSFAVELKVVGNQLILSGPVVDGDFGKIQSALLDFAKIDTAVLRNSPGGHAPTGYRTGELFRAKGLATAVSGYCYSSCSRMFLGGKSRHFTDDYPPEYTHVGFHGHYDDNGRLLPNE